MHCTRIDYTRWWFLRRIGWSMIVLGSYCTVGNIHSFTINIQTFSPVEDAPRSMTHWSSAYSAKISTFWNSDFPLVFSLDRVAFNFIKDTEARGSSIVWYVLSVQMFAFLLPSIVVATNIGLHIHEDIVPVSLSTLKSYLNDIENGTQLVRLYFPRYGILRVNSAVKHQNPAEEFIHDQRSRRSCSQRNGPPGFFPSQARSVVMHLFMKFGVLSLTWKN